LQICVLKSQALRLIVVGKVWIKKVDLPDRSIIYTYVCHNDFSAIWLKLINGTFPTCLQATSHGAIIDRRVLAISIHRSFRPCPCGFHSHRFCSRSIGTKSNYLYIWLPALTPLLAQGNNISCPHRCPATISGRACVCSIGIRLPKWSLLGALGLIGLHLLASPMSFVINLLW